MPKTKITIDPTNMQDNDRVILGQLLLQKKIHLFKKGESHSVITSGTEYDVMLPDGYELYYEKDKTFRIIGKKFGSGGQAEVFEAGTIKLQEDGKALFVPAYHERLIKREKQPVEEGEVQKRKSLATRAKRLHSKVTAIKDEEGTYTVYTAMRKFKGQDLFTVLENDKDGTHPLSIETRFELTRKLLLALKEQVHDLDLVHRDIKPENIVVDIDYKTGRVNSVHIIDFDFAKDVDEKDDQPHGTWAYLSPEAADNITQKSDMFALSIVLGLLWRAKSEDVKRPNPKQKVMLGHLKHYLQANFEPEFASLFTGIMPSLTHNDMAKIDNGLLRPMGTALESDRSDINAALEAWKEIEVAHVQDQCSAPIEKDNIQKAHNDAYAMRESLIQLSDQFSEKKSNLNDFLNQLQKRLDDMSTFINEVSSQKSVIAYLSIIDCRAFDNVDVKDPNSFKQTADKLMAAFRDNHKKLKELIDSGIESYHPEALKEAKRLMKKVEKCTTIDDMNDFNNTFKDKILVIFNKQKKIMEVTFTEGIKNAINYDDLNKIFSEIRKEENKFVRKEQGTVFKFFGEYGSTTTWQHIIDALQEKALICLKKEMSTETENKSELINKYAELFSEKSGRVFHNQFAKEFAMMEKQYPIRRAKS